MISAENLGEYHEPRFRELFDSIWAEILADPEINAALEREVPADKREATLAVLKAHREKQDRERYAQIVLEERARILGICEVMDVRTVADWRRPDVQAAINNPEMTPGKAAIARIEREQGVYGRTLRAYGSAGSADDLAALAPRRHKKQGG